MAIKCYRPTACSLDIYIILMSCQCYVTFDLVLVSVLTFEHLSLGLGLGLACQGLGLGLEHPSLGLGLASQGLGLGLGLELLSLESKPGINSDNIPHCSELTGMNMSHTHHIVEPNTPSFKDDLP